MSEVLTHFAHRTGYETAQRCPRKYYWQFVWDQTGLDRQRLEIPLARGIYVHHGLEALLHGKSIDDSISLALKLFDEEIGQRGLDVGSLEDSSFVYKEQRALIEAMLYGWWKRRLPQLLEQYEILEVEREEVWNLGEFDTSQGRCRLVWLGKADALLRERETNDLFIQSFKTTAEWDTRKDSAAMHDVQGLSELCAIEHRLADWWNMVKFGRASQTALYEEERKLFDYLYSLDQPPKIMGIRMEHLLAGQRREAKRNSGQKVQYCGLIRGYKKDGMIPDLDEYAHKFQWEDEFGTHRLGKGWIPFNAWEIEGGVRGWIDLMVERQVQAELGDVLDSVYVFPNPYYRQEEDVQDWTQQMIAEELRKFEAKQRLAKCKDDSERRFVLNTLFPMHRAASDYPGPCAYQPFCYEPGYATEPLASGLFKRRTPHHDLERESLVEITGAK